MFRRDIFARLPIIGGQYASYRVDEEGDSTEE
jgi:hypothetical protein